MREMEQVGRQLLPFIATGVGGPIAGIVAQELVS
jgi:uridine phosphorylase